MYRAKLYVFCCNPGGGAIPDDWSLTTTRVLVVSLRIKVFVERANSLLEDMSSGLERMHCPHLISKVY